MMLSSSGFKFNFQLQNDMTEVNEAKEADTKEQQCEKKFLGCL